MAHFTEAQDLIMLLLVPLSLLYRSPQTELNTNLRLFSRIAFSLVGGWPYAISTSHLSVFGI